MYKVYQLKFGDTIDSISNNLGVSKEELEEINGLEAPYNLSAGMYIVIPNLNNNFNSYEVKKGDTIYGLANKYNLDYNQLLKLNGLNKDDYIYPGEKINVPYQNVKFYITSSNDTISSVSKYFNVSPNELITSNEEIYLMPDQIIYMKDN